MFESFLEWADEQGLPFRSWADGLQEKGIPPIALLLLPLLLIGGAAFFLLSQGPATGSVVFSATTFSGEALPGVSVTLTNTADFKATGVTDAKGKVTFDKVPAGSVDAVAFSKDVVLSSTSFALNVKAGQTTRQAVSSTLQEAQGVFLVVDVASADAPTLALFDADGKELNRVAESTSFSFSVAKNAEYVVRAEQAGFDPDELRVQVGESNRYVTLSLSEKGKAIQARLHVRVVRAGPEAAPVANASVKVFSGDVLVRTAVSSEDGSTPPLSVALNASLRLVVSKDGFEESSKDVNVSGLDSSVSIEMTTVAPAFSGIRLRVKDPAGNDVYSPIVRLYSGTKLLSEQLPEQGEAIFNVTLSPSLAATIYKAGFLPVYVSPIKKDQLVVLERSDNRSARVRVHVTDFKGNDAVRVSVALTDEKSRPIGIPARLSNEEGIQVFDDVPLKALRASATDGVRSVVSDVVRPALPDETQNETLVELRFAPSRVSVSVSVIDHFSRQPVAGARVSSGNASCVLDVKGVCSLNLLESEDATFSVSAAGYSTFESAKFPIYPGVPLFTFELTSSSVAQNVRLRFDGVFDASGRKVNSLSPLSPYEARYAIVSPGIAFDKAEAEVAVLGDAVLVSGQSSGARVSKTSPDDSFQADFDVAPVGISADGFSQPSFDVVQGRSVVFVNEDNATHFLVFDDGQSVTIPEAQNRSVLFNKVGGFAFKSLRNPSASGFVTVSAKAVQESLDASNVLFEYAPFNGTRQLSVRFKTGPNGQATLQHRSAFFTPIETLRSPLEGFSESGVFRIDFAGTCSESVCVQWYFSYNGRRVERLELPFTQKADLVVNVFGLSKDGVVGVASGTPALKLLSAGTNLTQGIVSASSASVRVPSGASGATFSFQAVRLSQDASLTINVSDGRSSVFEAEAFVVVYTKDQPAMVVSVTPNRVEALSSSNLVFTVKDTLNQPVEGARVTVGDAEALESGNASAGKYVADDVRPESLSPISFEVTKEGFRPFTGSIAVDAPENAVDANPDSVALSVDSKEPSSASIQLTNKLADKLRASVSFTLDAGGQITDVSTSSSSLVLPGRGSASFDLEAAIQEDVLELAARSGQLKEKVRGNLHVRVSAKGFSQTLDIPFSVDASFSQNPIADAWTLTPDSLQFNLEPPRDKTASLDLVVSNTGPYPMVFNVEQTLGLSIQPASLTVAAGSTDAFTVKASLPREIDCFSQDVQKKGALTVYGSFQGLSSKKTAPISLDVSTSSLACQPPNGYRLVLPLDVRLEFLANTRVKTNPDGSTSVLLPTRELLWFASGASVGPIDAQVPENTAFVLDRRHVQPLPEGGWTIAFPTAVTLNVPSDADYQPFGSGQTIVTLDNAQIILPPGVQTPQTGANVRLSAAGVRVPAMLPVVFRRIPFNYDAVQNLLPQDPIEVKLPTDAVLDVLPGTVERKQVQPKSNSLYPLPRPQADSNLQNVKAIQLPSGERMAFGDSVGLDLAQFRVTLPAGTSLFVSRSRVNAVSGRPIEQAFELRLPLSYALTVRSDAKAFKTQDGQNALKITEDATVQASWALTVSKQQVASVLRVARENALTYLSGASARIPYDPSSVAKCAFTYAPPDSVSFSLPTGTALQKTAKGYEAILPQCDDSSRITFSVSSSTSATADVFTSPSVKKIVFAADSELLVGNVEDQEEKSVRTSGVIELTACLKDAAGKDVPDTLRDAKIGFFEDSLVSLPERVLLGFKENQESIDLGVLTPLSLGSKSGALTQLGSTQKISVHPNGQKVFAALMPAYPANGLRMPKGSALSFIPVCEKGSGRLDVSTTAEDVLVALDKDGKTGVLEVTFSNKNPELFKQKKEICLYNNGKQSVTLDTVQAQPSEALAAQHKDFFQSIAGAVPPNPAVTTERGYFSQPGVYGNRQRLPVEPSVDGKTTAENCRAFTFELNLPEDLLFDGKCIAPNKVPPSMTGYYEFKFHDVNSEAMASSEKHKLPVKMNFDAKEEDCLALQEKEQFADLTQVSVNYDTKELAGIAGSSGEDKLYFKAPGHKRFFAIVNNEEKPIRVKEIRGDGTNVMTCRWQDGPSGAFFDLKADKQIIPADVLLLTCTSNPGTAGKQGPYVIEFTGDSYHLTKTINVYVWPSGQSSSLYVDTPIGRTVPFFDPNAATPKDKQRIQAASYVSWAFADAPATTAATGAAPAPAAQPDDASQAPGKTTEEQQAELKARQDAQQIAARTLLDFRLCKKFFCTRGQADSAILAFTRTVSELIDVRLKKGGQAVEIDGLDAFCRDLSKDQNPQFRKSMLLQLTNVEFTADDRLTQSLSLAQSIKTEFSKDFGEIKEVRVTSTGSGSVLFSGCGLYRVTAILNPACAVRGTTPAEWKNHMGLDVEIQKLESCPVTLANAALLNADRPFAYGGNQLGQGVAAAFKQVASTKTLSAAWGVLSAPVTNEKDKVLKTLEAFGRLRQGVLGVYGSEANEKDEKTVRALYAGLYGVDATRKDLILCPSAQEGFKDKPCPAVYYEDAGFCWRTGGPTFKTLAGSVAGIAAFQTIVAGVTAPTSGGWTAVKALSTNYRLISTLSGCTASIAAQNFQGKSGAVWNSCQALDLCTASFMAGAIEMIPLPKNVGLNGAQRLAVSQSTTLTAGFSGFGAWLIQSAIGAGIIYSLGDVSETSDNAAIPVVPISIVVRNTPFVGSPYALEQNLVKVKRFAFSAPVGDYSRTRAVEDLTKALEAQGYYGPDGRRTANQVAAMLYDAGHANPAQGFDNVAIRAVSTLHSADDVDPLLASVDKDPRGIHALDELSQNLIRRDAAFAQNKLLQEYRLEDLSRLELFFNGLDGADKLKVLEAMEKKLGRKVPISVTLPGATRPTTVNGFVELSFKYGIPPASGIRPDPELSEIFRTGDKYDFAGIGMRDALFDEKIAPTLADYTNIKGSVLYKGSAALDNKLLLDELDKITTSGFKDDFLKDVEAKLTKGSTPFSRTAATSSLASDLRSRMTGPNPQLTLDTLQQVLIQKKYADVGVIPLPNAFGGMRNLMETHVLSLQKPGVRTGTFADKLRNALKLGQLYDQKGNRILLNADTLESAEKTKATARRDLQELLRKEEKAGRIVRGTATTAAIAASLLFNTDFRPVQVRVKAAQSDAHIIAVHMENGKPSAESICIQGVAQECVPPARSALSVVPGAVTPAGPGSTAGVFSPAALCGTSSVCLRLLHWPSGSHQSYALLAGFNDNVEVDAAFFGSLFLPEKPPVTDEEFKRLKLSSATIAYAPVNAVGFSQYQLQAQDPQDATRQSLSGQAQAIIDRMNDPQIRNSVPQADRTTIKSLSHRAISAFNAKKDAEGLALLEQANDAARKAQGVATGGS